MLEKLVKIMDLEAMFIVVANGDYSTAGKENWIYGASLPYSLELMHLDKLDPTAIKLANKKQYTTAIVNVQFNKALKKNKRVIKSTKEIRKEIYKDGFFIDGEKYVLYKRSSSKARLGSHLFIKEEYYKNMMEWSLMGLKWSYKEEMDIASKKAYESLVLSSIEKTITLNPKNIFLINDIEVAIKGCNASVTELIDGEVVTATKTVDLNNSLFDGQGLLDSSLFKENTGFMLLRNRYFKCAAFNTNLQKFFKDREITKLKDMFGKEFNVEDIKLITTPSSIKYLKFSNQFNSKEECYKHYIDNLEDTFGVCKSEHKSKIGNGNYNRLSYQIINSLELNKEEVKELLSEELEYIKLLKTDIAVFKAFVGTFDSKISSSKRFIENMLATNNKFQYTKLFKRWKNRQIHNYIKKVNTGKVKINNTDYCTCLSNPYEMLITAVGDTLQGSLHKGREIYTSMFKVGEEVAGFRNPLVCAGNIATYTNVYHKEFKYFNLTDNIVIVNSYDYEICDRNQGMDFDSDTMLLTSNNTIVTSANRCLKYPTPVCRIKADKQVRYNTEEEQAEVDYIISKNLIGEDINWSQILNSYYNQFRNAGATAEELEVIYNKISMCSSISQIEIDKAKKFINIDVKSILRSLKELDFIKIENIEIKDKNKEIEYKDRLVKPYFFYLLANTKTAKQYAFRKFDTPVDYIATITKELTTAKKTKTVDLEEILVNDLDINKANRKQIDKIIELINKNNLATKKIMIDIKLNPGNKNYYYDSIQQLDNNLIKDIAKLKITKETLMCILKRCNGLGCKKTNLENISLKVIGILYTAKQDLFIQLFKYSKEEGATNFLEKVDSAGDINIFGLNYNKKIS